MALLLASALPVQAQTVSVGNHSVTFENVRYDFPLPGQSTWFYTIRTGVGDGPNYALSHITFGLPIACADVVGGIQGAGQWGPTQNDLSPGTGSPEIGRDPRTEVDGVKFDQGLPNGSTVGVYFTVDGNYLIGSNVVATKSGTVVAVKEIPAPSITCEEVVPPCGNGIIDGNDLCDDGDANSDTEPDACRTDCTPASCGDGVTDSGEECDDGPANSDTAINACRTDCTMGSCGNGVLDPGELCDDGVLNSDTAPDACRSDCTPAVCGDGILDSAEACDDGDANSDTAADACRADCSLPTCGDGVRDFDEGCDQGEANSDEEADACRTDCLPASCGDGVLDTGEGCDDGDGNTDTEPNACRTNCAIATCGNGILDAGEQCDDGNDDNTDLCLNSCERATCGDGYVLDRETESCDDGNNDNTDGCLNNCRLAVCGDGYVHAGVEACDDGNLDNTDACLAGCLPATCGDGFVQDGVEVCDDGPANSDTLPNACRTTCTYGTCGDGVLDDGEACDDGAENSDTRPNRCRTDCSLPVCGDGVADLGEECDAGLANSDDLPNVCRTNCLLPGCGDGVLDAGEGCDLGEENSDVPPTDCTTACGLVSCGNGVVDPGETCDDGNDSNADDCRNNCTEPSCGDGLRDDGEACDDGNNLPGDGCAVDCTLEPEATLTDLAIDIADAPDSVAQNGFLAYTITVTNLTDEPAQLSEVLIRLDPNVTYQSSTIPCTPLGLLTLVCSLGTVDAAGVEVFEVVTLVAGDAPTAGLTQFGPCDLDSDLCVDAVVSTVTPEITLTNNATQAPTDVVETSTLPPTTCGDGILDPGEECDLPGTEDCANGVDDDGDGDTDCADPDCSMGTPTCSATCTEVPSCQPILSDPARIKFFDDERKDFLKIHARFIPISDLDLSKEEINFSISNEDGVIYRARLYPGDLVGNKNGTRWKYKDKQAKRGDAKRSGVATFRVRKRRVQGMLSHTFTIHAHTDLSLADQSLMTYQVTLGNDSGTLTGNWAGNLERGWKLTWSMILDR